MIKFEDVGYLQTHEVQYLRLCGCGGKSNTPKQVSRTHIQGQLIFGKDAKAVQWRQKSLKHMMLEEWEIYMQKTEKRKNILICIP